MNKLNIAPNEKYVRDIVTDYDALSERCDEFNIEKGNKDAQEIILCLKNTIRSLGDDVTGLSANQIGFDKRIICLNFNGQIKTFINPIFTNMRGVELSKETCHSEPGKVYLRPRNTVVDVTYQTPLGGVESTQLVGLAAKVMQHHMDHLDGVLLSDIGLEITEEFENATDAEKEELVRFYLDSLDIKEQEIQKAIENDPEAQKMKEAVEFMESVRRGETVLEEIDNSNLNESDDDE